MTDDKTKTNAAENAAFYEALTAFVTTFTRAMGDASVTNLLGTQHEHVGVMDLRSPNQPLDLGLKFTATIKFDDELLTPEVMASLRAYTKSRADA